MQDNPYEDGAPSEAPAAEPETEIEEGGETAVLSKSFLEGKGCKVGDQLTVRVSAIHGDDYEVEFVSKEHAGEEESEMEPEAEAPESMMAEYS